MNPPLLNWYQGVSLGITMFALVPVVYYGSYARQYKEEARRFLICLAVAVTSLAWPLYIVFGVAWGMAWLARTAAFALSLEFPGLFERLAKRRQQRRRRRNLQDDVPLSRRWRFWRRWSR